jgi:hypothetical protein
MIPARGRGGAVVSLWPCRCRVAVTCERVGGPPAAAAWPVSQVLAATIAVVAVPGTPSSCPASGRSQCAGRRLVCPSTESSRSRRRWPPPRSAVSCGADAVLSSVGRERSQCRRELEGAGGEVRPQSQGERVLDRPVFTRWPGRPRLRRRRGQVGAGPATHKRLSHPGFDGDFAQHRLRGTREGSPGARRLAERMEE